MSSRSVSSSGSLDDEEDSFIDDDDDSPVDEIECSDEEEEGVDGSAVLKSRLRDASSIGTKSKARALSIKQIAEKHGRASAKRVEPDSSGSDVVVIDETSQWNPKSRRVIEDDDNDEDNEKQEDSGASSDSDSENETGEDEEDSEKVKAMAVDEVLDSPVDDTPAYFLYKLYPHQVTGLKSLCSVKEGGAALCYDTGLGKTALILAYLCNAWAAARQSGTRVKPCLVAAPKSVVLTWSKEFRAFVSPTAQIRAVFITEKPEEDVRDAILKGHYHLVVASYTQLLREFKELASCTDLDPVIGGKKSIGSRRGRNAVQQALLGWRSRATSISKGADIQLDTSGIDGYLKDKRPDGQRSWAYGMKYSTVVFDEGHVFRNATTLCFTSCFLLNVDMRIYLSASPVHNSIDDLYNALRMVRAKGLMEPGRWELLRDNNSRADRLAEVAKSCLFWVKKTDIEGLDMVPLLVFPRGVTFKSEAERTLYEYFAKAAGRLAASSVGLASRVAESQQRAGGVGGAAPSEHVLAAIGICRQFCVAPAVVDPEVLARLPPELAALRGLGDLNGWFGKQSSKFLALRQLIEEHVGTGEKFVIFSNHLKGIDVCSEVLSGMGIESGKFVGKLLSKERAALVDRFKKNPTMRCMVLSYGAGGTGLSFEWASRVILLDPWWNPMVLDQAMARAHRLSSKKEVRVTIMFMAGSIEKAILDMGEKKRAISQIFYRATTIKELLRNPEFHKKGKAAKRNPQERHKFELMMLQAQTLWEESKDEEVDKEREWNINEKRRAAGETVDFLSAHQRRKLEASDSSAPSAKRAAVTPSVAAIAAAPEVPVPVPVPSAGQKPAIDALPSNGSPSRPSTSAPFSGSMQLIIAPRVEMKIEGSVDKVVDKVVKSIQATTSGTPSEQRRNLQCSVSAITTTTATAVTAAASLPTASAEQRPRVDHPLTQKIDSKAFASSLRQFLSRDTVREAVARKAGLLARATIFATAEDKEKVDACKRYSGELAAGNGLDAEFARSMATARELLGADEKDHENLERLVERAKQRCAGKLKELKKASEAAQKRSDMLEDIGGTDDLDLIEHNLHLCTWRTKGNLAIDMRSVLSLMVDFEVVKSGTQNMHSVFRVHDATLTSWNGANDPVAIFRDDMAAVPLSIDRAHALSAVSATQAKIYAQLELMRERKHRGDGISYVFYRNDMPVAVLSVDVGEYEFVTTEVAGAFVSNHSISAALEHAMKRVSANPPGFLLFSHRFDKLVYECIEKLWSGKAAYSMKHNERYTKRTGVVLDALYTRWQSLYRENK